MVTDKKVPPKRLHHILQDCNLDTECRENLKSHEALHVFREVRPQLWKKKSFSLCLISTSRHHHAGRSGGTAPRILNLSTRR
jgi:hypothetical protein